MKGKAQILRQLEALRVRLGKERDALRDLCDDVEALFEAADESLDSLNMAIERLSELV